MKKEPDLTSVRTLVTSATELARVLNCSTNNIYRMIEVNRIPGRHLIKVAKLYDVEIQDLLHLTGSDKHNTTEPLKKPKNTLETLLLVYRKLITIDDASRELGVPVKSLHLTLVHWGDQLPTLHKTLVELEAKAISIDQACQRLGVAKFTLHGIRRKYGFAPGRLVSTKPKSNTAAKRAAKRAKALDVIAGRLTAEKAAEESGVSYRTMFRATSALTHHKLHDLTRWPLSFRAALVEEIERNMPNFAEKWLNFVESHRLIVKKRPKDVKTPETWKNTPVKRMLVGVLLGEATIDEIAASRGAYPAILAGLFTSDLQPLGVSDRGLLAMPVAHQAAVAEILLATLDRKRRFE